MYNTTLEEAKIKETCFQIAAHIDSEFIEPKRKEIKEKKE